MNKKIINIKKTNFNVRTVLKSYIPYINQVLDKYTSNFCKRNNISLLWGLDDINDLFNIREELVKKGVVDFIADIIPLTLLVFSNEYHIEEIFDLIADLYEIFSKKIPLYSTLSDDESKIKQVKLFEKEIENYVGEYNRFNFLLALKNMKQKHQPGFCIFNSVVAKIILRLLGYPVETYHVILFPKQKEVLDDTIVENYFSFHSVNVLFLSDSKKFIFDTSLDEQTKDEDMIIYEQVNTYKDTILAQLVWLIYDMKYIMFDNSNGKIEYFMKNKLIYFYMQYPSNIMFNSVSDKIYNFYLTRFKRHLPYIIGNQNISKDYTLNILGMIYALRKRIINIPFKVIYKYKKYYKGFILRSFLRYLYLLKEYYNDNPITEMDRKAILYVLNNLVLRYPDIMEKVKNEKKIYPWMLEKLKNN
jgi:hypothetical protein